MSLLMLATLLAYAAPSHAAPAIHQSPAPREYALTDTHSDAVVGVVDHEHEQTPCNGNAPLDNGTCCSVAQCVTMHGGLPVVSFEPLVPHLTVPNHRPILATPEGIGSDPALRPPL
ncbi:hypothetical protein [Azospirillum isscasi]|uniref:Uncharacterized protein n=1 Tax=Azospirillum isscasi TaxID=3053926 RepID=A0ABU0WIH2_9PROT|nr:hypothetical protein [Azospirillum isscasi]MDQ2102774.1 hypothetical protein [Azospirillum isscasi]